MITYPAYRRLTDSCHSVNELNRLHITLERRLLPSERRVLIQEVRGRAGWLGKWIMDGRPFRSFVRRMVIRTSRGGPLEAGVLDWGMRWSTRQRLLPESTGSLYRRERLTSGWALYSRRPGVRKKILVGWTGQTRLMMLPTPDFLASLVDFEGDVLLLLQRTNRGFSDGISGLGDDYETAAQGVAEIVKAYGYEEVTVMGVSGGAYPALESARFLAVNRMVLLGPGNLDKGRFKPSWLENSSEQESRLGEGQPEVGSVFIAAGKQSPRDVGNAKLLAERLGAECVIVPSASHGVLYPLLQQGKLVPFMRQCLEVPSSDWRPSRESR